jgi:hypothetical protein
MTNYIYMLDLKVMNNKIKIGSTKFPHLRLNSYQNNFPFNVNYLKLYQINCYQAEKLIKKELLIINNGLIDHNNFSNELIENFFINNKINFQIVNIKDCSNNEIFEEYKKELLM